MNINQIYPFLGISKEILGITDNSKKVKRDYIFVAIKGHESNGKTYIKEALENGACLIITDQIIFGKYNHLRVKNAKLEYMRLLALYYHYNHEIYTVGITGTDGKTTTASILNNIFNTAKSSAYIGTNGISYLNKNVDTKHTTPTPDLFFQAYNVFKKHHINDLVMEVSSEGILDKRVENIKFDGAIFTNLSHEHLNAHKTMRNYLKTKAKLFSSLDNSCLAVINTDDFYSHQLYYYTKAKIVSYGIYSGKYQAKNIKLSFTHTSFDVYYKGVFLEHYNVPLFGKYNVYNTLAAIAYSSELGIDPKYIKLGVENLNPIPGRFMHYTSENKITGIVDFAHTPNALKNLLINLKEFAKKRIILVIGAAGNKDKSKRSVMGQVATSLADITIFTSEDPKDENLFSIFTDLTKELVNKDYYLTISRKDAIKLATRIAQKGDIIVVTGKGNETKEVIMGNTFIHSDYQILKNYLDKKL